jgi:hypothetical protein
MGKPGWFGASRDIKLVSNAMANATRRKIMAMMVEKERTGVKVEQRRVCSHRLTAAEKKICAWIYQAHAANSIGT